MKITIDWSIDLVNNPKNLGPEFYPLSHSVPAPRKWLTLALYPCYLSMCEKYAMHMPCLLEKGFTTRWSCIGKKNRSILNIQRYSKIFKVYLVGIPAPLKNMKVKWDDRSQYMDSHKSPCSKPPIRYSCTKIISIHFFGNSVPFVAGEYSKKPCSKPPIRYTLWLFNIAMENPV